jgi:hypothetical protein
MLKPRQHDLLQQVARSGSISADEIDGRVLRPLRSAGLVQVTGNRIEVTPDGLRHAAQSSSKSPAQSRLNQRQEELLRLVLRTERVPASEVDGRVARALVSRGLVTIRDDLVTPTSTGHTYLDEQRPKPRGRGRRGAENPRAAAVRRAAGMLEAVLPPGAEVLVGNIMAAADDLVDAFRRHAQKLDESRSA